MKTSMIIFAHRGASHIYPENTLLAFREAVRQGANGLELDVHLTKDGHPVVIHDERVNRTTNGKGLVKNHTLKEIKELSAGHWFHPRFTHVKVPTLEEVFQKAKSVPVYLNIEMKNLLLRYEDMEKDIIRLIYKYDMAQQVILSSFNPDSVALVNRLDQKISTAFLYFGKLDHPWSMAYDIGAEYIQPPVDVLDLHLVKKCHQHKLLVCPYDVNRWRQIQRALSIKVDGIITMYPERVRNFVE